MAKLVQLPAVRVFGVGGVQDVEQDGVGDVGVFGQVGV